MPKRRVSCEESIRIAEQQAELMVQRAAQLDGPFLPVSEAALIRIPRIRVELVSQRIPGYHVWDKRHRQWLIQLSHAASSAERRVALAVEFKSILDTGVLHRLYMNSYLSPLERADRAGIHFAACFFVPIHHLMHAWNQGIRTITELARLFDVTEDIIRLRLWMAGLKPKRSQRNPLPCAYFNAERTLV
ncbi:ImmA/IrrE family metallo-endopeptidase [Nocardia sp. CA-135953]|uniref:ImmA/IrrE family metallo-endopeptidase n=1 Tax=Nocardia sp. CA-135953 TaxID=3239978 RepID=UPI003D9598FA